MNPDGTLNKVRAAIQRLRSRQGNAQVSCKKCGERLKEPTERGVCGTCADENINGINSLAGRPKYPATMIVHTPSGPIAACDIHAGQIAQLISSLGAHCALSMAVPGEECATCANESKSPNNAQVADPLRSVLNDFSKVRGAL